MKSKILFLALLLIGLVAFKGNPDTLRVKKRVSLIKPGDSIVYTYTADGKILSYHAYPGSVWNTYEYSKNMAVEHGNIPQPHTNTYYLNAKGDADSMKITHADTFEYCIQYFYDEKGFYVSDESGCGKKMQGRKRVIGNGNVVKAIDYYNGAEYAVSYYEYYTDKPNVLGERNQGLTYMGRESKNLLKRFVIVRNGIDTDLVNLHHYHFDTLGRVSVDAIYGRKGELTDSVRYFY